MEIAIITGAAGLIGSEAVRFLSDKFDRIIGIDNDFRKILFGLEGSTFQNKYNLLNELENYVHFDYDIRNYNEMEVIFKKYGTDIKLVIHTAAQPSHDWAAKEPLTDFTINANGTLNLLELTRLFSLEAVFIFTSTNKVYGDQPNYLPLVELESRWELKEDHKYYELGIDESLSIDNTLHSLFGASKVAADVLAQEYGKYFNMKVGIFRGGCLTGPQHAGVKLHGFLSYLVKCAISGQHYKILGYNGKQVRDNIHSSDLVNMFWHFYNRPRKGEVYNVGGSRHSNCSILEGIKIIDELTGIRLNFSIVNENRVGDHIWWISDVSKFRNHFPEWEYKYNLNDIIMQMADSFMRQ